MNMTTDQIKSMVASGKLHAEGSGEGMMFDLSALRIPKGQAIPIDLGEEAGDEFTLKLSDEGGDADLTSASTPPPMPASTPARGGKAKTDSNVFGDDTVDLMDSGGATETIELTDDSIADGDSLMGGGSDTLAGGPDTMGTDTLLANDSLAASEGQETFLGADILEGLSGDTTAEITSEQKVGEPGIPVQYVQVREQKSPVITFALGAAVVLMVLSVLVFVAGMTDTKTESFMDTLIFAPTTDALNISKPPAR
jgi:hypothetical protein